MKQSSVRLFYNLGALTWTRVCGQLLAHRESMKIVSLVVGCLLLAGCAGGPTHDYHNPTLVGAKFRPPITMTRVEEVGAEKERLVREGYTVVGATDYGGKHPEAKELKAQAKRAGANHVIYSSHFVPNPPGSWHFSFGRGFGSGGTGGGSHNVHIVFLGRPDTNGTRIR